MNSFILCGLLTLAAGASECEDHNDDVITGFSNRNMTVNGCGDAKVIAFCDKDYVKKACCVSCNPPVACLNNDTGFLTYMKTAGMNTTSVSACVDAPSCTKDIAGYCCAHCSKVNVTIEVPWADDADPVHVYLSYGQSNCAGSGSADLMKADGMYPQLFEKNTNKSKFWFAGLTSRADEDSFAITAAWAGCVGNSHGPEFAYGNRLQELTGNRVLIFKYCYGGTSAKQDWNPDFHTNAWNKTEDNGTSAFLKGLRTGTPKYQQYLRATYNLRLMREQLDNDGVRYEFKGVFWRQSSADQKETWQQYGADQIRIFNAIRDEVDVHNLPIIMEGDSDRPNIQAGKVYAAKVLCHTTVGREKASQQLPSTLDQCAPKIADPCTKFRNYSGELENQFGWPVGFPENYKVPKTGHANTTSQWFVQFHGDVHDDYAGMWWNGIAMANAYVREHTNITVPHAITEWDIWAKWPLKRCTSENPQSEKHFCWDDPSEPCVQEDEQCGDVTAESCRATEKHYTTCPCACQAAATCTAEPPVINRTTLTYFPDLPEPLSTADRTATATTDSSTATTTTTDSSTTTTATTTTTAATTTSTSNSSTTTSTTTAATTTSTTTSTSNSSTATAAPAPAPKTGTGTHQSRLHPVVPLTAAAVAAMSLCW